MHEKFTKKETPPQKTEEEAKALALAQARSNGNACCACGKKVSCGRIRPQKDTTEYEDWAMNEKKS